MRCEDSHIGNGHIWEDYQCEKVRGAESSTVMNRHHEIASCVKKSGARIQTHKLAPPARSSLTTHQYIHIVKKVKGALFELFTNRNRIKISCARWVESTKPLPRRRLTTVASTTLVLLLKGYLTDEETSFTRLKITKTDLQNDTEAYLSHIYIT